MPDAHELWAAAQLAPGEGIEDGVARIEALLALPAPAGEPEMPKPFGYVSDGFPDGLHFSHKPWDGLHLLVNSTGPVFSYAQFQAYGGARAEHARRVAIPADAITVNLVRHVGLDKHTARQCEHIVQQILAAPPQGEQT